MYPMDYTNISLVLGDQLVYECYHTASETLKKNLSVVFYYIDSDSITYVKFVIMDVSISHAGEKVKEEKIDVN